MELTEEKRGIWLNFPECTPEDGEQVVVKRNGWYEILVYNEYHQCWDDSEDDDYCCDLSEEQATYQCSLSALELRIGNWVYDGESTQFPMQVSGIGKDWVYLDFPGNEGDVWEADVKDLRPIPITTEVLKKAGFSESYCYDCKQLDDVKTMTYYKHESRLRVWYKTDDIIFECHGVHHLHQLQNAYFMATGEELEVQP